ANHSASSPKVGLGGLDVPLSSGIFPPQCRLSQVCHFFANYRVQPVFVLQSPPLANSAWSRCLFVSFPPVQDGSWWTGTIAGSQKGVLPCSLLDDPGPTLLRLPAIAYTTAVCAANPRVELVFRS
ncbi:unnamed protein product, partial [Scytosiphon promiscuus]